ncbi:Beta-glucuronosyltransferase GlcAT14A [Vitis vinifera]|uniref:Beta-glucuronosyltransferase GlcAT14A n=1 Tax=Vitis vinifera TaxID=29760 RepID=A0A438I0R8_VITVI|nr:Beta-glucuronosyltransferase GlcAT14A [Vitis vinifera]
MTRFCLDNTIQIVCRILHTGLGQPAQNPPSLLHQLRVVAGGILPDGHMQLGRLQEHHLNNDLHYITWDTPPKQHPRSLGLKDFKRMYSSNRPFARKFKQDDRVLDKIDRQLLKRHPGQFSYGGWCSGDGRTHGSCSGLQSQSYGVLRPGPGSRRLKTLITKTLPERKYKRQCR